MTAARLPLTARNRLNPRGELPITAVMTLEATLERVSAIRQALNDPAALLGAGAGATGGTEAPVTGGGEASFASALLKASGSYAGAAEGATTPSALLEGAEPMTAGGLAGQTQPGGLDSATASDSPYSLSSLSGVVGANGLAPAEAAGQGSPGSRIVAIAESQLGQTEQPPGSNESPAIAQYRSATAGAIPGAPWCAYFASWAARQAGEPIGARGEGAGAVSEVWSWAQSTGRAIPNGPGVVPQPGDLIVFGDEHVGIVRDVLPDGQIQTIEGNY